jgi:hypothetical protein
MHLFNLAFAKYRNIREDILSRNTCVGTGMEFCQQAYLPNRTFSTLLTCAPHVTYSNVS